METDALLKEAFATKNNNERRKRGSKGDNELRRTLWKDS